MEAPITVDRVDGIATVLFNRPDSYNALNAATARELAAALKTLREDHETRGIVITGAGKAFSAGGDIRAILDHAQGPAAAFYEMATLVHGCISEIRNMPKPVVAAINGVAAGGGFSLALACDFRVMAEGARLRQGFTSNGLCIDAGGTFMLPRLVGMARALEIAAFDEPIVADQALHWGLVTRVVDDAKLLSRANRLLKDLFRKSLHSFSWSKRLLSSALEASLETQLEREHLGLISCAMHSDGVEGMKAFLEKREPRFNRSSNS